MSCNNHFSAKQVEKDHRSDSFNVLLDSAYVILFAKNS